jgi:CRISPR-associated protein Cas5d
MLRPIRYFSILRNEVNSRASERTAREWMRNGGGYDAAEDRAQRHTLALRDVAYVIRAMPLVKAGVEADVAKYRDQFRRRVHRGQCFAMPYLGCREFTASFGPPDPSEEPIEEDIDLGRMLLDIEYDADSSGRGGPRFFEARLVKGALRLER